MPTRDEKAARLAAQLRANLRRRKAQARGLDDAAATPTASDGDDAREREG